MYQILIVEDEDEAARGRLASLIERYGREHDAKFKVTRHRDASSFIKSKTSYDLVFMDIDLPGMSGMEAAGLMRAYDEETPLIFVTNLAQYAIRGYEVDALDFIVKPVSWYHFSMRMDKAMRAMRRHSAAGRLKVSTRSGVRVIPTADVLHIDVSNHDLVYHICDEDEPLRVRTAALRRARGARGRTLPTHLEWTPRQHGPRKLHAFGHRAPIERRGPLCEPRPQARSTRHLHRLPRRQHLMPWNAAELIRASLTCAQILFAVLLFSSSLPVRDRLAGRVAIVGVIFVAWAAGMSLLVPGSLPGSGGNSSTLVVIFGLSLVAALFTVVFVFQASIWTGFFCATAGYTLQNLTGSLWRLTIHAYALGDIGFSSLGMVIPYLMVYLVAYLSFISRIRRKGLDLIEQRVMLAMMVVVIFAIIGYDVVVKELEAMELPRSMVLACRLAHVLLCLGVLIFEYEVLYSRQLELEVASVEQIMRQEKEQFQISRETIEAINLKCHDIKHQIRSVGVDSSVDPVVLREMEQQVDIYDAAVRTGNEALDVILTEKSLERENVTLSCIADGDCIAFMAASDVYSLMGNALDHGAPQGARHMGPRATKHQPRLARAGQHGRTPHRELLCG